MPLREDTYVGAQSVADREMRCEVPCQPCHNCAFWRDAVAPAPPPPQPAWIHRVRAALGRVDGEVAEATESVSDDGDDTTKLGAYARAGARVAKVLAAC